MDRDDLEAATDDWVEAGLIDEETAAEIHAFEADRTSDGFTQRRLAMVVAVMGAVLVGAGILTFLAAQWDDLGTASRSAILVLAPVAAGAPGVELRRRALPRAGLALWVLGAFLVGPSLFLLASLHAPDVAEQWLLLGWGLVALPMGHVFATRLGTGIGLGALLLAGVVAGEADTGVFVAAMLGAVVIAAAVPLRETVPDLIDTYRVLGVAPVVGALLWLNTMDGRLQFVDVIWGPHLLGALGLALGAAGIMWMWSRSGRAELTDGLSIAIPIAGTLLALGLVATEAALPEFATFLLGQVVLLGVLIAFVVVGVLSGSRAVINLVIVGFFLQVVTLLLLLADRLPGTLALIVAGVVLIAAAIALERGRRRLVDRLPRAQ